MERFPIEWFYIVLAAAGGASRYLQQYVNGQPFSISIFSANIVLSGFSGFMFAVFGQTMNLPPQMLYVLAGVGGFMGANTLEFLSALLKAKMSK